MALSAANLGSNSTSTDAASYTIAVTLTTSRLVLVSLMHSKNSSDLTGTSCSDNLRNTYTLVRRVNRNNIHTSVWRSVPATAGSATITVSNDATMLGSVVIVDEFSGADTTTPVVQDVAISTAAVTTITGTLAALASADNAHWSCLTHQAAEATTQGTGFTKLADQTYATPARGGASCWLVNDTTCDWSWVTSAQACGVSLEVSAAAAGGTSKPKTLPLIGCG